MKPGDKVRFVAKVFAAPYAPFYDAYFGHTFEVVALHYRNTHLELKGPVKVQGYVHPDELELVEET